MGIKRRALQGRASKGQVSKGQAVKGRWEMSGIRIGQGYRTAKGLQRTVEGFIEGGRSRERTQEECRGKNVQRRTAGKDK